MEKVLQLGGTAPPVRVEHPEVIPITACHAGFSTKFLGLTAP